MTMKRPPTQVKPKLASFTLAPFWTPITEQWKRSGVSKLPECRFNKDCRTINAEIEPNVLLFCRKLYVFNLKHIFTGGSPFSDGREQALPGSATLAAATATVVVAQVLLLLLLDGAADTRREGRDPLFAGEEICSHSGPVRMQAGSW